MELGRPLIPHRMEPTLDKEVNLLHRSAKKHRRKTQSQKKTDVRPGSASKKPQGKPKAPTRNEKSPKRDHRDPQAVQETPEESPKECLGRPRQPQAAQREAARVQRATQGPQKRSNGHEERPKASPPRGVWRAGLVPRLAEISRAGLPHLPGIASKNNMFAD